MKECPYCGGLLSGSLYKWEEGDKLKKYLFCPDCGYEVIEGEKDGC